MIPSPPSPNVLFQGKNSTSPNVWPGGELVPRDRNGAWLQITRLCQHGVMSVPAPGAAGRDAGLGRARLGAAASLEVWLRCSWRDAQAAEQDKYPLEAEFAVCVGVEAVVQVRLLLLFCSMPKLSDWEMC